MFNNRYMLEKVIGRGSFGQVVRALDTRDNTHVAIKIIKNNSLYVEQALSEVRMTSYLNSIDPEDEYSIMRLRDKFIFRGHQCLVLELLSFSLYELLKSTEFYGVSLNLVRKFCKQILKCLSFLSRKDVNIIHCDLKPENVLLRHPQRSTIKVVDFGASCKISDEMFIYVQSRFYRAPEVILGLPYNTQIDIWSLGCMLIELHTGYPVFAGKDESDQIAIIVERLGLPPKNMLRNGKKTKLFFDQVDQNEWELKPSILKQHDRSAPGSKPIKAFIDYHTGTSNGKRKRASGGHSEDDYEVFLSLVMKMLRYDPEQRITAVNALDDDFSKGISCAAATAAAKQALSPANSQRSANSIAPGTVPPHGKDSPPPMPAGLSPAIGGERISVEPGRKAPLQRRVVDVDADADPTDAERSLNNLTISNTTANATTTLDKASDTLGARTAPRSASDMAAKPSLLTTSSSSNSMSSSSAAPTAFASRASGSKSIDTTAAPKKTLSVAVPIPIVPPMDKLPDVDGTNYGAAIRASKSEPAMEAVLAAKKNNIFQASDWAEEVGIEPPPWRSGGRLVSADDEDMMRNVPRGAAGGGCDLRASTFSVAYHGAARTARKVVTFATPEQQQQRQRQDHTAKSAATTAARRRLMVDNFQFGRDVNKDSANKKVAGTGVDKNSSSSGNGSNKVEINVPSTSITPGAVSRTTTVSSSSHASSVVASSITAKHSSSSSQSNSNSSSKNNSALAMDSSYRGKGLMRDDDSNNGQRRAISFGHGDATPLLFGHTL